MGVSPFRKAKGEQAAIKMGIYGASGSGKTFTSLLIAEGLAKKTGKRVAFIDTERGTDFYAQAVEERKIHPKAFDFDALYTRSLTESLGSVRSLNPDDYCCLVIDSITHMWEAAKNAYGGRQTSIGTIPMQAWGKIKKPYKELMNFVLSSPMHVIFCGRQGNSWKEDDDTGELKNDGYKMKAEGETPYEPHILVRMEAVRPKASGKIANIHAFFEKDRTGILSGQTIINPTFDTMAKPFLKLLGLDQAAIATEDEAAAQDAEAIHDQDLEKEAGSKELLETLTARLRLANTLKDVKDLDDEIRAAKKKMLTSHTNELKKVYLGARDKVSK